MILTMSIPTIELVGSIVPEQIGSSGSLCAQSHSAYTYNQSISIRIPKTLDQQRFH
jgi:hypothetical protein